MANENRTRNETILVVDDDEMLRTFVVDVLERAKFHVLSADSGPSAVVLSRNTMGSIDLLLTDWDMPEMSGIALGETLKAARPDIHVMQMSGGAHDTMMVLNYGWAFLQKPFVAPKLVEMITDVLNTPNRSQPGGASFDSRLDTNPRSPMATHPDDHPSDSNEPHDRGK